jgi:hypothetical protein
MLSGPSSKTSRHTLVTSRAAQKRSSPAPLHRTESCGSMRRPPSTGRTALLPMLVMLRLGSRSSTTSATPSGGEQGCRVRPRLGRDPNGQPRVRLGHQRGRGREDLARRVHHPSKASRAYPQRIRRGRSRDPPRSPKRHVRTCTLSERVASSGVPCRYSRSASAWFRGGSRLL